MGEQRAKYKKSKSLAKNNTYLARILYVKTQLINWNIFIRIILSPCSLKDTKKEKTDMLPGPKYPLFLPKSIF